jgi:hypothetical protein
MSFERKFKKSLSEQWCMRFETLHPDDDNYDGVITHIKTDFIVLREEIDFEFDGIIILPKRFIKSVRDGKYDKCCNEVIRFNKTINKLHTPKWLDKCETIQQVLSVVKKRDIWLGVETVFSEGTDSAFYIGPITNITDEGFSIKCYDSAGKWEKEYQLDFDEVFRIEFDSKYCNYFNAFMKSKTMTVS